MMGFLRRWLGLENGHPPVLNSGARERDEERWTEEFKAAISTIDRADVHSVRTIRVAKTVDPASALRRARP